ncbi:hepcidin [Xenopus laevis]|uniref:Hepcidin n=1 Tax=Xenopus laevis TaxID=8355 RepID=A0A8J0TC33_XENLA|nr:hepcidin [Xenopus laevis]
MKSTPICCLLLLLSLICYRGHSASLSGNEIRVSGNQISETAMEESNVLEPLIRSKRHSHLSICIHCCNCCKFKGCGKCCLT